MMQHKYLNKRYLLAQKTLNELFPRATTALKYKSPFELLVATILSAQCTDILVNKVTAKLFKKYGSAKALAQATETQIAKNIYPVTFYKNKARSLKKTALMLTTQFHGKVPDKMGDLLKLAGVARKTANVVLGHAFGKAEGVVVDTHVARVASRLGLTKSDDPKIIERDLMIIVPRKNWIKFADQLILFGRKYCTAREDKCAKMGLKLKHFA